jgi:hypothetical protein
LERPLSTQHGNCNFVRGAPVRNLRRKRRLLAIADIHAAYGDSVVSRRWWKLEGGVISG